MTANSANFDLEAQGIHFAHGRQVILNGVDTTLQSGDLVALLGANGAGKSTLFRILLGFLNPAAGRINLNGHALGTYRRRHLARHLAYVPQAHVAPFPYSVRDIVLLGRLPATGFMRASTREDSVVVEGVLERLSIRHLAERPYTELSGGERQLTLIGRALAQGAGILVMDEPMTGLDYGHQALLLRHLTSLTREGHAVLFSTHNPDHAMQVATRVDILRNGLIAVSGAPKDVVTPKLMNSLYGVDVSIASDAAGRRALIPELD